MRALLFVSALTAFALGVFISRIVVHGYTDHGHLDVFHLVVALVLGLAGAALLVRAARRA